MSVTSLPLRSELEGLAPFLTPQEFDEMEALLLTLSAESSLHEFVKQAWNEVESVPFVDNWHIRAICEHLEAVTDGRIQDLIINIPPGCSKSLITCVFWPAWVWIKHPEKRFLFASYGQELSTRDSVACRNLMDSPWYRKQWGHVFDFTDDQNQKTKYVNTKLGWRIATSVGGRGTGEHPDFVVVDDPINAIEAGSEAKRAEVITWWTGTIATRGKSRKAKHVLIMQRLHEGDLTGFLLKKGTWEHICLPMKFEPDRMKPTSLGWTDPRTDNEELLYPDLFDQQAVNELVSELGPYGAAAQLQQTPAPSDGNMFPPSRVANDNVVDAVPVEAKRVRYWDLATSESDKADWTVGVLMAKWNGIYYVEDVVRGQWESADRDSMMEATCERDARKYGGRVENWFEKTFGMAKVVTDVLIKKFARFSMKANPAQGDKELRAGPLATQWQNGNVRLLRAAWNPDYVHEMAMFPRGSNDDQTDGSSGAFNRLELMTTGVSFGPSRARAGVPVRR